MPHTSPIPQTAEYHKIECIHTLRGGRTWSATLGYIPVSEGAEAVYHCRECGTMQLYTVSDTLQISKMILSPGYHIPAPGGRAVATLINGVPARGRPDVQEDAQGEGEGGQGVVPEKKTDRVNPVTCANRTPSPQIFPCTANVYTK